MHLQQPAFVKKAGERLKQLQVGRGIEIQLRANQKDERHDARLGPAFDDVQGVAGESRGVA